MGGEEKVKKIEELVTSSFNELIEKLLVKMGYSIVFQGSQYLVASAVAPMSIESHAFIFSKQKLSGNIDLDQVLKEIKDVKSDKPSISTLFLVSNYAISKGFRDSISSKDESRNILFLGRDEIIDKIDSFFEDYWKHDDIELLDYEKEFMDSILKESELKSLKIYSDKYKKLLNIFIEPKIVHYNEDNETQTPVRKNVSLDSIVSHKPPIILAGEAGMGKSTLLKKIGEKIIINNQKVKTKNLPIFLSVTELFDASYVVLGLVEDKLQEYFEFDIKQVFDRYGVTLLIDSIDEFDHEHQESIVKQLNKLYIDHGVRYILATRNTEKSVSVEGLKNWETHSIVRFSNAQIEQFVGKFFLSDGSRAEKLLDALRENRIIEKLPVTPLSLSLISILFEENDLEIPATITDIYDNFNSLLLGKPIVSSRIEFIDISFKERILSLYALELLKRKGRNPMKLDEFITHFSDYYKSKTIPLKKGTLEEALKYLVESTGIIYLKNNTYVCFNHDSFMEYYASIEIFKHQRGEEQSYIDNFFDTNWQNSAVFYGGQSKDMSDFLTKINEKIRSANQLNDYFASLNGAGYLLQALYQTDNQLRKETVDASLEVNIKALELFMKLSADDKVLFKSFKLPIIWLMNLLFFHENFNSGTLREPLRNSFADIYDKYTNQGALTSDGYKALILALTLSSNRIEDKEAIEKLIYSSPILDDSILTIISEIALEVISTGDLKDVKLQVKGEFKKVAPQLKHLMKIPASKLRFTPYDKISSSKRVKIITEGKTDASIIEHAFMTLTSGESPYWSIKPSGNESGSAREVNKCLMTVNGTLADDEIVIGIFDHDDEGIKEYNMLKKDLFLSVKNNTVKKHKDANVYAILLPVPGEMEHYLMPDQKFNYFEIEHYLPEEFLRLHDALWKEPLSESHGIYSIKDSRKSKIAKYVCESVDPKLFLNFHLLLEEIDEICDIEIEYES